jgi:uncharacterized protein (TIGR02246 family)
MNRLSAVLSIAVLLAAAPASAEDPALLGSFAITWEEIQARPTSANGMSKPVVRSPTATLDELEMHVTAVPPGRTTHPPHTHPNEEVIVIREGTVEVHQNGRTRRVGPGAILFMASNEPHNVTNVGDTTAVYHVINWKSPGTVKKEQAPAGGAAADEAADETGVRSIKAFYKEWSRAAMEAGAQGYASYFAEDAVLLPPDAPPVAGRAAIRDWQQKSQDHATYRTVPEAVSEDEVRVAGGQAVHRTTLRGRRVPKAGGEGEPFEAKYLDVLRRKADGSWEFTHRMWSDN